MVMCGRHIADFRSDCVTRPTPEMYRAMAEAPLGDDVLGDDPTVKRLESRAAQLLGKAAALFVPSGTMGNSICIKVQTRTGDEVLLEGRAHVYTHELAHLAVVSQVLPRPVRSDRGVFDLDDLRRKVSRRSIVTGRTSLVTLENTHNFWSGRVIPLEHCRAVRQVADEYGLAVHLDGARLFNAQVASGRSVAEYAQYADTVMCCLSKGLACPVGSIIAGPQALIEEARFVRKMLGGGMRQVGVLAACGIVALETMIDRLALDHRRARQLAQALAELPGVELNPDGIETNIVIFSVKSLRYSAGELVRELEARDVWCLALSPSEVRFVTHKDTSDEDIGRAIAALKHLLG